MKKIIIPLIVILWCGAVYSQTWKETITATRECISKRKLQDAINFAMVSLDKAEQEFGAKSDKYAQTLSFIAEIFYYMGKYGYSIDYYKKEIELLKNAGGKYNLLLTKALNDISVVYQQTGNLIKAEEYLSEAVSLKREIYGENDTSYALSLQNLALLNQTMGNYGEAESLYLKSAKIKKEKLGTEHISYANTIFSMSGLYDVIGNYKEAVKCLEESIRIFEQKGADQQLIASAQYRLALEYNKSGNPDKAEAILKKVKDFRSKSANTKNPDYANTLYNLAMVKWSQGKFSEANKILKETGKIVEENFGNAHPLYISCLNSIGVISALEGKTSESYEYLAKAVSVSELFYNPNHPKLPGYIHSYAGILKDLGKFDEAEIQYIKAMDMYLLQLKNNFSFMSDNEKIRFYDLIKEKLDLYNNYVVSRIDEKPELLGGMFNYHIAVKALLLNNTIKVRKTILESGDDALISKFGLWKYLKDEIAGYYSLSNSELKARGISIDSLEKNIDAVERDLSSNSSFFQDAFEIKLYDWKEIQQKLKKDEAAVEIIRVRKYDKKWSDSVYYVAMILTSETKNYPDYIILKNGYDLEKYYIRNYFNSIRFRIPDKDSYKVFWQKIDNKLTGIRKVNLSPDGIYNKININTFLKGDGNYIINSKSLVLLSNTKELLSLENKTGKNKKKGVLIGNPKFELAPEEIAKLKKQDLVFLEDVKNEIVKTGIELELLPGTKLEIERINNLLQKGKWETEVFEDADANVSCFNSIKDAGLLHIATHGYFLPDLNAGNQQSAFGVDIERAIENPLLRSGIILSGATNFLRGKPSLIKGKENGILTAFDIMNMNFDNIGLVVLSACESGLGEIKDGEGVFGLQRSFLIAGAGSMIMSLWKVNDKTTQELMEAFYKEWISGKSLSESFREAQLKIKEKYPHPYYWGAFILTGKD